VVSGQWAVKIKIEIEIKIKIFTTEVTEEHGVNLLEFAAEHGDYVVGGYHAYQLIVFVDYREGY
jgi:hypothetical protein